MLTAKQIAWCKLHDWFIADYGDGTILVHDNEALGTVEVLGTVAMSNQELKWWAGY